MANPLNYDEPDSFALGSASFVTTHWSVVLEAAGPESPGSVEAFGQIYRDYWFPLYAYVRRRGHGSHEAEELTQTFFVSLLERERLCKLKKGGGRFRSFLLKALQNFLANEWDRATAKKRGGGNSMISLDEVDAESRYLADSSSETAEANFERNWAYTVIEIAMKHLQAELRVVGKEKIFQLLRPHLQGDRNGRPYAELAVEMGISESGVKMSVHRLRQRYGELLRAELARTVGNDAEVEDELRHLIEVVSI